MSTSTLPHAYAGVLQTPFACSYSSEDVITTQEDLEE